MEFPDINFVWTVVISLVVGVSANLLTPKVSLGMSHLSKSFKNRRDEKQRILENSIQHLVDNPIDEVNLRIEKNGRYMRSLVLMVASLIISALGKNALFMSPSILLIFFALVYLVQARKYNTLVGAAWEKRKERYGDIDLG